MSENEKTNDDAKKNVSGLDVLGNDPGRSGKKVRSKPPQNLWGTNG